MEQIFDIAQKNRKEKAYENKVQQEGKKKQRTQDEKCLYCIYNQKSTSKKVEKAFQRNRKNKMKKKNGKRRTKQIKIIMH